MNVEPPRLLRTCRSEVDALGAAIRGAIDQRERRLPGDFKALLNRLDSRRTA